MCARQPGSAFQCAGSLQGLRGSRKCLYRPFEVLGRVVGVEGGGMQFCIGLKCLVSEMLHALGPICLCPQSDQSRGLRGSLYYGGFTGIVL